VRNSFFNALYDFAWGVNGRLGIPRGITQMECVYRDSTTCGVLMGVVKGQTKYVETFKCDEYFHVYLYEGGDLWIKNGVDVHFGGRGIIHVGGVRFVVDLLTVEWLYSIMAS